MNYSLQDLQAVSIAFLIFPLFVFVPGYVLGCVLDPLRFRQRTPLLRTLLSIPFSIAFTPILVFIAGRISWNALWTAYAILWVAFVAILVVPRYPKPYGQPTRKRDWRIGLLIGAGVAAIMFLSLIDLQIGQKLYYSVSAYDYNFRAAVIDSIARRGLPPVNPFLHPGHDAPFRYHYFWFMICSLVDRLGGSLVSARQAQIAGSAWMGIGICSTVALCLRFFDPRGAARIRQRTLAGLVLLAVSGLDIFPLVLKSVSNLLHHKKVGIFGSAEWWSGDPVTSWVHALLWVPHHVAGVIACLIGFLILWDLDADASWFKRALSWLAAGLAFASSTGLSIHVTFAFGFAMLVWGAVTLWQRWFRRTLDLAMAGVLSAIVAAPYLLSLLSSGEGRGTGAPMGGGVGANAFPLMFGVRQFRSLDSVLEARGLGTRTMALADLLLLPLNYLMEFGFFAVVAYLFLRRPQTQDARSREYRFAVMSITGAVLLICSFVRSSIIANNDLGWRGMLIAQLLLLIVAVEYFPALWKSHEGVLAGHRLTRQVLIVFFWIGLLPSLFELATQRFHPVLMDANLIAPEEWTNEELGIGASTASLRQIYATLNGVLPADAVVQHNPNAMQDHASGLYADRQRVLMGAGDYTSFGGNSQDQERARKELAKVFAADSTDSDLETVCREYHIDAVVVKNNDAVWLNPQSWVWKRSSLAAASAARAFACAPNYANAR